MDVTNAEASEGFGYEASMGNVGNNEVCDKFTYDLEPGPMGVQRIKGTAGMDARLSTVLSSGHSAVEELDFHVSNKWSTLTDDQGGAGEMDTTCSAGAHALP